MKLTNSQIYYSAEAINYAFAEFNEYIPAKVNFALQKNTSLLAAAAKEIEQSRLEVAKHYGSLNEEGDRYEIAPENLAVAEQELADLFNIEQELNIRTFSIDALGDLHLTPAQMAAIMFMIDED